MKLLPQPMELTATPTIPTIVALIDEQRAVDQIGSY